MPAPGHFDALPAPPARPPFPPQVDRYPLSFRGIPSPVALPWGLRPLGSAEYGCDTLDDGRARFWIRHQPLKDVTPRMLAWWFRNLDGYVDVNNRRIHRYRAWHPYDHIHVGYARRLADGSVGPGAALRIKEVLGSNPDFLVDVTSEIEKLDEEGFIHNPVVHGVRGIARMEYAFHPVAGGTVYENCLLVGLRHSAWPALSRLVKWLAFPQARGEAWLRHNIEEVGMLENLLPDLYRRETGLDA